MSEQVFTNLTNCGPVSVYVTDGVVTRILPLVADEADFRPWTIEAGGKQYSPPKKFNLAPMVHAERRRLYSDERIKYPMKRVDFDPNGERTSGGTFTVDERGRSWVYIRSPQPLTNYKSIGITIEPAGGSHKPTGPKMMGSNL